MMNTVGVFQTAAMFSASWNVPMLVAPSPKNVSATWGSLRSLKAIAAPTAIGSPAPTIALAPMLPFEVSMRCIDPPTPFEPAGRATHQLRERDLGLHAQRERLAVTAVRVRLDVARLHGRDRPDRDRLLALAQVRRALDQTGHEELLDLLLEDPDLEHLAVPAETLVSGVGHGSSPLVVAAGRRRGWLTRRCVGDVSSEAGIVAPAARERQTTTEARVAPSGSVVGQDRLWEEVSGCGRSVEPRTWRSVPRPSIPGGVNSINRVMPWPFVITDAEGAWLKDADGRRYLDYHAAFGPIILGHADPG